MNFNQPRALKIASLRHWAGLHPAGVGFLFYLLQKFCLGGCECLPRHCQERKGRAVLLGVIVAPRHAPALLPGVLGSSPPGARVPWSRGDGHHGDTDWAKGTPTKPPCSLWHCHHRRCWDPPAMVALAQGMEVTLTRAPWHPWVQSWVQALSPPSPIAATMAASLCHLVVLGTPLRSPQGAPREQGWPQAVARAGASSGGGSSVGWGRWPQNPPACPAGHPSHIPEHRARSSACWAHLPLPVPLCCLLPGIPASGATVLPMTCLSTPNSGGTG